MNKQIHGHDRKDKFNPGSRETILETEMKIQKKKNVPPPNAYINIMPLQMHKGLALSKESQLRFYDDCHWKSM